MAVARVARFFTRGPALHVLQQLPELRSSVWQPWLGQVAGHVMPLLVMVFSLLKSDCVFFLLLHKEGAVCGL